MAVGVEPWKALYATYVLNATEPDVSNNNTAPQPLSPLAARYLVSSPASEQLELGRRVADALGLAEVDHRGLYEVFLENRRERLEQGGANTGAGAGAGVERGSVRRGRGRGRGQGQGWKKC
jgi:hypothetical protein